MLNLNCSIFNIPAMLGCIMRSRLSTLVTHLMTQIDHLRDNKLAIVKLTSMVLLRCTTML